MRQTQRQQQGASGTEQGAGQEAACQTSLSAGSAEIR